MRPLHANRRQGIQATPVAAGDLDESGFVDEDGNLLDPAATPFVPMPDPKARDTAGPCRIWIVTEGGQGYLPTEATMENWEEAQRACDAANSRMGRSPDDVGRIILASMIGGTA